MPRTEPPDTATLRPIAKSSDRSTIRRLRVADTEALRRLSIQGPLTIPEAYDCGHKDSESHGHGMNRLVAAGLVVYCDWDLEQDDARWIITARGRSHVRERLDGKPSVSEPV